MRNFKERSKQSMENGQETESEVVWSHLKNFWLSNDDFIGHVMVKRIKDIQKKRRGGVGAGGGGGQAFVKICKQPTNVKK